MPSECMAIGREPRSEKTEGFRACPASREAERTRLRENWRKPGAENRRFSSVSGFEGSRGNSASKEAEEIRLRRKRRKLGFERSGENSASKEAERIRLREKEDFI